MEISKNLLRVYQEYNQRNQIQKEVQEERRVNSNKEKEKSQKITTIEISDLGLIASENRKASLVSIENAKKAFQLFNSLY
jgi:hypothetical protein